MAKCDLCRKKDVEVCDCLNCGSKFCSYCGNTDRNLCEDCGAYEEDSIEIENEEDFEADEPESD